MRSNLGPDIDLAARLFTELRDAGFDGVGITREAYGPGEQKAHALVRAEAEALGLEIANDAAGNLYMTLPGRDRSAKRIVLGSHLDSVPQGGNYDGAAGVLAGLATVAGMRHAGFVPARDITVLAVRAEEAGAWFPTSYPGSHAALGRLPPEVLSVRRMDTGRTLEEHMRELDFDPDVVRAGKGVLGPHNTAAYLELHIEQGPVLDAQEIPVAIVTGIPGSRRLRAARVVGEYNHSGATRPSPWRNWRTGWTSTGRRWRRRVIAWCAPSAFWPRRKRRALPRSRARRAFNWTYAACSAPVWMRCLPNCTG